MDINNINDIEVLKNELKKRMFEIKKDIKCTGYVFKEGHFYDGWEDDGVTIYSGDVMVSLSWEDAKKHIKEYGG